MNLPTDYHETLERNREAIERIDEILSEEYCFRCARPAAKCACGIFRNCSPFPPIPKSEVHKTADSKITTTTKG